MSVRTVSPPVWLPRVRRPQPRVLAALVAGLVIVVAGWFWLRDSSLAAVRTVEVSGVAGAQGEKIRTALENAARSMTTLHVRHDALETAVASFSIVRRLEVEADFPHTMRIHVVTNVAVGAVVVDGRRIAVTSDGTVLRDAVASRRLPRIPVRVEPAGARLTEPRAVSAVAVLAAAPAPLRSRIQSVVTTAARGLEVRIAHGPVLWFGDVSRLAAKWAAVAAVLADPQAAGAHSIGVWVPERPAVGGLPDGAPAVGESDIPTTPPDFEEDATDPAEEAAPVP